MSTGDKRTDTIIRVEESLNQLRQEYIDIDMRSIDLCVKLLRVYADKLECPDIPPDIQAVIWLLNKVNNDYDVINETVLNSISILDSSNKVLAAA